MRAIQKIFFIVINLMFLASCRDINDSSMDASMVMGTVSFSQSVTINPNWGVSVKLEDVSIADASSVVLGEFTLESIGELPIKYFIKYKSAHIDPRKKYSVSASVYEKTNISGSVLIYSSTESYPVLTSGYGNDAHVIVKPVN